MLCIFIIVNKFHLKKQANNVLARLSIRLRYLPSLSMALSPNSYLFNM